MTRAPLILAMLLLAVVPSPPPGLTAPLPSPDSGASPAASVASGAAQVQGALVTGQQRLVLSHGVALLHDGAEGFDGGAPLPELRLQETVRRGPLRALFVSFDPDHPDQLQISPLVPPATGPDASASFPTLSITRSGGPGPGAFETFALLAEHLRAGFTYARGSSFPPAPSDILSLSFLVDLPLQREPAVTARVQGGEAVRAAAESPSSEPALPPGTPEAEMIRMLRGLGAEQLRDLGGDALLLVERGDRAVLVIGTGEGLRTWIPFRRHNGSWQLD